MRTYNAVVANDAILKYPSHVMALDFLPRTKNDILSLSGM